MTQKESKDQSYEETISKIEEILKYESDLRKALSVGIVRNIRKTFQLMQGHLKIVIDGKSVPSVSPEDKSLIRTTINDLVNIAIEKPILPIFRDLAYFYSLVALNWSEAVSKSLEIERDTKIIHGIIQAQLSLLDTIYVLQILLDKAKKMQRFEPPAFELSRAYLDNFKKHLEEKEDEENKKDQQNLNN